MVRLRHNVSLSKMKILFKIMCSSLFLITVQNIKQHQNGERGMVNEITGIGIWMIFVMSRIEA